MMISTKGRYALRVMIDLVQCGDGSYVPLRDIAARQGISEKYLEAVIKPLMREGLLAGMRGKGGGYRLTKAPEQYTVKSILLPTEGSLAPVSCLTGEDGCERSCICPTLPVWRGLERIIDEYLSSITLAELAAGELKV